VYAGTRVYWVVVPLLEVVDRAPREEDVPLE
jgi:hypothetical protein